MVSGHHVHHRFPIVLVKQYVSFGVVVGSTTFHRCLISAGRRRLGSIWEPFPRLIQTVVNSMLIWIIKSSLTTSGSSRKSTEVLLNIKKHVSCSIKRKELQYSWRGKNLRILRMNSNTKSVLKIFYWKNQCNKIVRRVLYLPLSSTCMGFYCYYLFYFLWWTTHKVYYMINILSTLNYKIFWFF